jgi:hypothetical protein
LATPVCPSPLAVRSTLGEKSGKKTKKKEKKERKVFTFIFILVCLPNQ